MYMVHAEAKRRHWIPGTGVTDGCKPACGYWELSLGLLQEQLVLFIMAPSLQPLLVFLKLLLLQHLFIYVGNVWLSENNNFLEIGSVLPCEYLELNPDPHPW